MLPKFNKVKKIEYIEVVVSNFLQMLWCECSTLFCAVSETSRDVIDALLNEANLPYCSFVEQIIEYQMGTQDKG